MPCTLIPVPATASLSAESLGADEFARLIDAIGPFSHGHRFAVAVSGGPDSMALAYCLRRQFGAQVVLALIVDHGLRPESAAEANEARERLAAAGIQAEILRWEHALVVTRLHISARKARYRLLTEACNHHGITDLLLAHQQEDQAETILMRLAKGSGVDGLAGMHAIGTMKGIRLLRPLLNIPKERLIATCREAELSFVEDVSNRSDKFARGRLRKVMPLLADEGLTIERLIDLGARASEAKAALEYYTHAFVRASMKRDDVGIIRIGLAAFRDIPRAIAGRALTLGLQSVHAEDYAPEHGPLMRLRDALCSSEAMTPRTLHGCLISKSINTITLMREFAGITDAPVLHPGESVIWDKRWRVTLAEPAETLFTIRPLGSPSHGVLDALAPGLRRQVPQGRARASLPALWQGEQLALIPSLKDSGAASAQLVSHWPPG